MSLPLPAWLTCAACLRDAFRSVLSRPDGRLATFAVRTFGYHFVIHPHLHVLAAHGRFDDQGRLRCQQKSVAFHFGYVFHLHPTHR